MKLLLKICEKEILKMFNPRTLIIDSISHTLTFLNLNKKFKPSAIVIWLQVKQRKILNRKQQEISFFFKLYNIYENGMPVLTHTHTKKNKLQLNLYLLHVSKADTLTNAYMKFRIMECYFWKLIIYSFISFLSS